MKTAIQGGWFDHRRPGYHVPLWTARGVALSPPYSIEVVLATPTSAGIDDAQASALRATLEAICKDMAVGRKSRFDAVYCVSMENGVLQARFGVRNRMITKAVWEWVAARHDLDVIDYLDVHAVDALEVSERILAEPLSARGLAEDVALKIAEQHLAMNGGRWVLSSGKPFIDVDGRVLRGVQEARERAIALWEEDGRTH